MRWLLGEHQQDAVVQVKQQAAQFPWADTRLGARECAVHALSRQKLHDAVAVT